MVNANIMKSRRIIAVENWCDKIIMPALMKSCKISYGIFDEEGNRMKIECGIYAKDPYKLSRVYEDAPTMHEIKECFESYGYNVKIVKENKWYSKKSRSGRTVYNTVHLYYYKLEISY